MIRANNPRRGWIKEATMAGTAKIPNKAAFLSNTIPKTKLISRVAVTNIVSNKEFLSFMPCSLNRFSSKCSGFWSRFPFSIAEVGSFSVISHTRSRGRLLTATTDF